MWFVQNRQRQEQRRLKRVSSFTSGEASRITQATALARLKKRLLCYVVTAMEPSGPADKWPIPRQYSRFLIDLRLFVRTDTVLHGRTKNISEHGMAATVAGDITLRTIVELQFRLPQTREPTKIYAQVRYRQGAQYGFEFINVTNQQSETTERVLRQFPIDGPFLRSQRH